MITKFLAGLDWKHWILSHLVVIVGVAIALVGVHAWLGEHDARLNSEIAIKGSEAKVSQLEQQIAATNAAAAQKVQVVTRIVHNVATPAEAIAAIPQVTDSALNARAIPNNPVQIAVDYLPLIDLLGQAKSDAINLAACTSNLTAETSIVAAKQTEIVALKRKPSFWHRVGGVAKAVGVGVGIGFLIAGKV